MSMSEAYNSFTETSKWGYEWEVQFYYDDYGDAPWAEGLGYGDIRAVRSKADKKPGERILRASGRGNYWLYDFQQAVKNARCNGHAKGEQAVAAVEREMEYFEDYLNDNVWKCVVEVRLVGDDSVRETMGGVEDGHNEKYRKYAMDTAKQLMEDVEHSYMHSIGDGWKLTMQDIIEKDHQAKEVDNVCVEG